MYAPALSLFFPAAEDGAHDILDFGRPDRGIRIPGSGAPGLPGRTRVVPRAFPGTCMFLRGTHRLPENSWSGCFFLRTSGRSFFLSGLILPPLAPAHFQRREVNLQGNHVHPGTLHGHGQPHPLGKMRHFTNNHLMVRIILKPVSHIRPESESFHGNEAFHRNF